MNHPTIDEGNLHSLLGAYHGDPFSVLGMHQAGNQLVVRVFRPDAREVTVQDACLPERCFPAVRIHEAGVFEALIPGDGARFQYLLRLTGHNGGEWTAHDPYTFQPLLGPLDLHLFGEGNHWQIYEKLGAHLCEIGGVAGCTFAVWAPSFS